jgi:hypothetical protein
MSLQRPIVRDWPTIDVKSLPPDERKAAAHLQGVLFQFSFYYHDFRAAIELYDHSYIEAARAWLTGSESWAQDWMSLAARDGAMTIFNFGEALKSLGTCFKDCPTLRDRVNHDALRSARKLMTEHFPNREVIRHSIGHSAEMAKSLDHRDKNSIRGPYEITPGLMLGDEKTLVNVRNSLQGRTFRNTIDGKMYTYDIRMETMSTLNEIRLLIYSAFLTTNS